MQSFFPPVSLFFSCKTAAQHQNPPRSETLLPFSDLATRKPPVGFFFFSLYFLDFPLRPFFFSQNPWGWVFIPPLCNGVPCNCFFFFFLSLMTRSDFFFPQSTLSPFLRLGSTCLPFLEKYGYLVPEPSLFIPLDPPFPLLSVCLTRFVEGSFLKLSPTRPLLMMYRLLSPPAVSLRSWPIL